MSLITSRSLNYCRVRRGVALLLVLGMGCTEVSADTVRVAVASNFMAPMQRIAAEFERRTGHNALLSSGATGKLYAQIVNGAPFDILLAADDETPKRLVADAAGVTGSAFTYAIGRLVLWSAQGGRVDGQGAVLREGGFRHLAIANPRTAPYGLAAVQALRSLGMHDALSAKLVQGENIAQALQFVASGNAELGFVALSQLGQRDGPLQGSRWLVPATLHEPIRQDALLLRRAQEQPAALALMRFLQSESARAIVREAGYELPDAK
jgi:molybdate transport system substrate-binding protein